MLLALLLLSCGPDKGGAPHTESPPDDSAGPDSRAETAESGAETAESGAETAESGESGESGETTPSAPPVLADYDAEPREASAREDGYLHVDSVALVDRLVALNVNTYAFLIYHSPSDWEDLAEYIALAEPAGLITWVYLVPPAERPATYPPYEGDYVAWAEAIGALAAEHPSITAIAMDDFNGATDLFTGAYVCEMMEAARAYAPELAFYAVDYYPYVLADFAKAEDRACVDGVIFPYTDLDSNAELAGQIDEIASMREGYGDALQLSFPWSRYSAAGDYGRLRATCGAGELSFAYNDDFPYETEGYHVVRVREEGDVLYEEDVAWTEEDSRTTLTLTGGEVTVGIEDDLGVSNFGVEVNLAGFDAPSCGDWRWEASDDGFAGTFTDVEGWTELELIPMVYATSTSWHAELPTTETVAEAVRISLEAWEDGQAEGVITYCLDKTEGSADAEAVGAIYAEAAAP